MSTSVPRGFEGSFGGDSTRLRHDDRMECGVCWWIYEPALGDPQWQVPADTAFSALPAHWRCPRCDAAQTQFMRLANAPSLHPAGNPKPDRDEAPAEPLRPSLSDDGQRIAKSLADAYRAAATHLRALPVFNPGLDVAVRGPRRCAGGWVGVAVTPWCMNLFFVGDEPVRLPEGTQREIDFPSGRYRFTVAYLEHLPPLEVCSLFSPMEQFEDQSGALAVATEALRALMAAPDRDATEPRKLSRRGLFRPGPTLTGDAAP